MTFRLVVAPLRGPGQSPVLPFACCVGSLSSVRNIGICGKSVILSFDSKCFVTGLLPKTRHPTEKKTSLMFTFRCLVLFVDL